MKRIALIIALLSGSLAHAGAPPSPYLPSPHLIWDAEFGGFQSSFSPNSLGAMLISPAGTGADWTPMTGGAGGALVSPNSTIGLLTCSANCTDALRATWSPWTGTGGGGGGAAFPATPGVVYSTSTTASRNATSSDIQTLLPFQTIDTQSGTSYTLSSTDCVANGATVVLTATSAVAVTLPTTGITAGCWTRIKVLGSGGSAVLTPASGTIDSGASLAVLYPGDGQFQFDGTNWKAFGGYGVRGASSLTTPGQIAAVTAPGIVGPATSPQIAAVLNTSPSTTLAPALLPAATATTQGAVKLGSSSLGLNHVTYQVLSDGDSYASAQGATQLGLGYTYLTIQDVPAMAPSLQKGVPGTLMPQIANVTALNWVPNLTYPSVLLTNGGNNDYNSDTCSHAATSNCITNYQESASANAMWAAIPPQQRLCASSGATATGTWTSSVTVPFSTYNCSTITTGTALASIVSGSTLTFSVPNTNNGYVGVTQATANASTGTYTIGIGPAGSPVLQTNPCTGTTVFSGGPCGGTAMPSTPGMQRNQFFNAAWAGQSIQVVVTTTNTGSTAIMATDYAVTTWPANTSSAWVANSGAAFDITGIYSNAAAATVTQLRATGANVFLVDIRAALLALAGGGVSLTPTADCPVGSTSGNHPSNCGNQAEYRAEIAAQQANNYIYSFPQLGGTTGTNQGVVNGPLLVSPQLAAVAAAAPTAPIIADNLNVTQVLNYIVKLFDQGTVGAGFHFGTAAMPDGTTGQLYESMFGSNTAAGPTYGCFEPAPNSTNVLLYNTVWAPTACVNFLTGSFTTKGSVSSSQIISSGTAPTIAAGAAAGTAPTVAITGFNMAGRISITTGTVTLPSATLATITFGGTVTTAPQGCTLQPVGVNAVGQVGMVDVSAYPTTTGWAIGVGAAAIPASTTYTYSYVCQ